MQKTGEMEIAQNFCWVWNLGKSQTAVVNELEKKKSANVFDINSEELQKL